ncbi:MAG: alanine racemase, partial [Thermoanaerobaculia bacterium]
MLTETPTPAFLVDRPTVQRNCDRMRDKARASGVAFRPHVKTHKTVEIGRMQHTGAAGPITVSTLAEAEHFARDRYRDITYAVPIAPSREKLTRVAELAAQIERLSVLVDSERALRALEEFAAPRGFAFDVFLKVDCGYHRAGVDPESPDSVRLAMALARSESVRFQGLLTHAGHSYNARDVEEIRRVAAEESGSLTRFRALLSAEGLGETLRSIGSTPTASVVERFGECDEVRPG